MSSNSYSRILDIIREQGKTYNPPPIFLGEVVSTYQSLVIKTEGIELDKDNLLVCESINYWSFTKGDKVLLLATLDKQTYIVIDKVVSL